MIYSHSYIDKYEKVVRSSIRLIQDDKNNIADVQFIIQVGICAQGCARIEEAFGVSLSIYLHLAQCAS